MSGGLFRFIHAGDLHLEQPLGGLAEIPEHLRDVLMDAPRLAAERVFQTALSEAVDFVILAGDVLDPEAAGPGGLAFILDQLERLAERDIAVYWAGGRIDPPDRWPASIALPDSVHLFPQGSVQQIIHHRDGEPLAAIMGQSWDRQRKMRIADFRADPAGLFSIGVAHGSFDSQLLSNQSLPYWALGGEHRRRVLFSTGHLAQYAGTPQGRSPAETGPHGCTLVVVSEEGSVHSQAIDTDEVRCHSERIEVADSVARSDLERLLADRLQALAENLPERHLLISWTLVSGSFLTGQLRRGPLAGELAGWLRGQFGHATPAAWTVSLEAESPADVDPQWVEEETILGDFLRAMRQYQDDDSQPLHLEAYLSPRHAAGSLACAADLSDPAEREHVLNQAAMLGVDLLRGDVAEPESNKSGSAR